MPNTKLERLFPLDRSRVEGMRPRQALPNLSAQGPGRSVVALRGKLSHDDISGQHRAEVSLIGIIIASMMIMLFGLSIWKTVQFQPFTTFFGGNNTARLSNLAALTAMWCSLLCM
jgi:thiosulfate reductase cytochrome b subunit